MTIIIHLFTILPYVPCLLVFCSKDRPITYLYNTLHYYEHCLRDKPALKKKLVGAIIGEFACLYKIILKSNIQTNKQTAIRIQWSVVSIPVGWPTGRGLLGKVSFSPFSFKKGCLSKL